MFAHISSMISISGYSCTICDVYDYRRPSHNVVVRVYDRDLLLEMSKCKLANKYPSALILDTECEIWSAKTQMVSISVYVQSVFSWRKPLFYKSLGLRLQYYVYCCLGRKLLAEHNM